MSKISMFVVGLVESICRIPNSIKLLRLSKLRYLFWRIKPFRPFTALVVIGFALLILDGLPDYETEMALVRVVDGDTLDYQGRRLRIKGIDTPEPSTYGNAECVEEARLGDQATQFAKKMVIGTPVMIEWSGDQDQFGRELAHIRVDGKLLSDILIDEGLARTWRGRQVDWCRILK